MARGDQLARQWRIIQTLVSSRRGKTVAELVKEENCHPRTISLLSHPVHLKMVVFLLTIDYSVVLLI
ncbi:MAG: hypothetical protein JSU72_05165 [Deltaproteobacteria bacterium]|nr:MAG: hypothetical protein JSU72_05165 [Deltaproteobacteria bacterium]